MATTNMPAQAELNYQYVFDAQWVQSYTRNASIYLEIRSDGDNQTAYLYSHSGSWSTGDLVLWNGPIPTDALHVEGIHSVSIYLNTCEHEASYSTGCDIVDATATSLPGWENFRTWTQTSNYHTWDGLVLQQVGNIHDRFTSTVGSVNGYPLVIDNDVPVHTWSSRMGRAKDVLVSVTTH